MKIQILYLDSHKSGAIVRALRRFGEVSVAPDINQALYLIAENDFDYYFVCADTPQAQAFLKHLGHDPQLPPPSGVVLLTDNLEEDCTAWSVDTFITRSRIKDDIPFVFSHLRREPTAPENVLSITPTMTGDENLRQIEQQAKTAWKTLGRGSHSEPGAPAEEEVAPPDGFAGRLSGDKAFSSHDHGKSALTTSGRFKAGALFVLFAAVTWWLFAWGPFTARKAEPVRINERRVAAESVKNEPKHVSPLGEGTSPYSLTEVDQEQPPQTPGSPASTIAAVSPVPSSGSTWSGEESSTGVAVPPTPQANRPPSASVNGPTQVMARQSATFSASGSDPDGDSISFSWGGSTVTRCWSTPGLYSVSVTVTDSRGASSTASMSVRVI